MKRRSASLLGLLLVLTSCDDAVRPEVDLRVPVAVGHRWLYDGGGVFVLRPEAPGDPVDSLVIVRDSSSVTVAARVAVLDSIEAFVFRNELRERFAGETTVFRGENWYADRPGGLYLLAHRSATLLPLKAAGGRRLRFAGRTFASPEALRRALLQPRVQGGDSLWFEAPPRLRLQYPLRRGDAWTFRPAGEPWRIQMEVASLEWVEVPAGRFLGARIDWRFDLDDDGDWDEAVALTEYVAEVGIVRQDLRLQGVELLDAGGAWLGTADSHETFVLRAFEAAGPP